MGYPPIFHPNFFFQNDSEWLEMDFKHNFSQCNILTRETLNKLKGSSLEADYPGEKCWTRHHRWCWETNGKWDRCRVHGKEELFLTKRKILQGSLRWMTWPMQKVFRVWLLQMKCIELDETSSKQSWVCVDWDIYKLLHVKNWRIFWTNY